MKSNNESGRSLVEMLGVLTIIGILGVGVISSVNFGMESMRIASAYDEVELTAQGVRDLYSWQRNYPLPAQKADMKAKICANGIFDRECDTAVADAAAVPTSWGVLQVLPNNEESFTIELTGVPEKACTRLLAYQWKNVEPETTDCVEGDNTIEFTGY